MIDQSQGTARIDRGQETVSTIKIRDGRAFQDSATVIGTATDLEGATDRASETSPKGAPGDTDSSGSGVGPALGVGASVGVGAALGDALGIGLGVSTGSGLGDGEGSGEGSTTVPMNARGGNASMGIPANTSAIIVVHSLTGTVPPVTSRKPPNGVIDSTDPSSPTW